MITLLFFILGAFSISSQTILLRQYMVIFEGSELGIGFFFSSWFLWIAVGAWLVLFFQRLSDFFFRNLSYLLFTYSLALPVQIYLCSILRSLAGVPSYEVIPLITLIGLTMLLNFPVSFLTGIIFSLACRYFEREDTGSSESVTRAYISESLGSFAAGAFVTYFLLNGINSLFIVLSSIAALSLVCLFLSKKMETRGAFYLNLLILIGLVTSVFTPAWREIDRYLSEMRLKIMLPQAEMAEQIETPYQIATAATVGAQMVIFSHGEIIASFPSGPEMRDMAALIMAQTEAVRKIIVIGAGGLPLTRSLLDYDIGEVTLIEQDKKLFDFIKKYSLGEAQLLNDSRVKVIYNDPLLFFKKLKNTYDAVVLLSSEPRTLVSNRLFVKEFYEDVRRCLNPKGIFVTEVSSAENYIGSELALYGRSVYATLKEVFKKVLITPGEKSIFIASPSEIITLDPYVLKRRYESLQKKRSDFPSQAFISMLPPERVDFTRQVYESGSGEDLVNTQERPKTFLFNLLVLFKQSNAPGVKILKSLTDFPLMVSFIPLLLLFILLSHYQIFSSTERLCSLSSMLLTLSGGASISIQILLLSAFQARFGTLFVQLGLANALFMVGLVAGSRAGQTLMRILGHKVVFVILSGASLFAFALPVFTFSWDYYSFHLLFFISGSICGALWPAGGLLLEMSGKGSGAIAAHLESADHWGAFIGSAICGIIVLPVSGVQGTSITLGLLFSFCLVLVSLTLFLQKEHKPSFIKKVFSHSLRRPSLPMRKLWYVFAFASFISLMYGHIVYKKINPPKVRFTHEELQRYVHAERFERWQSPFMHYLAYKKGKSALSYVIVSSMSLAPDVKGFAGPLNLLIVINHKGIITTVSLIESRETPTYIKGIDRFLKQFEGKHIGHDFFFSLDDESSIDVMSGATVTSEAALRIINRTKAAVGKEILHIKVQRSEDIPFVYRLIRKEVIYMIMALLCAVILYKYGSLRMRTVFLGINLFLAGIVFNLQLSISQLLLLMRFDLPSLYDTAHFLLLWGALFLALFFGPVYCSYLCPFGALQELVSKVTKPLMPTPEYAWYMRSLKYILLGLVVILAFHYESESIFSFDPLQHAFALTPRALTLLILGIILLASFFYFRFYCRYLCPVGALFCLFNKTANRLPIRPERNYKKCDLGVHSPWDIDCIQCNRCTRK
jgi:spermidine synthase/Na+-translocating ferredoxin:NAD+ oxidoreductase RnfG subunit